MGLAIGLGVIVICVICLFLMGKKAKTSDNSSFESSGEDNSIESNKIENVEDKNAYNIQRIADDVHFIKTVVLVYVILTIIGVLLFLAELSY